MIELRDKTRGKVKKIYEVFGGEVVSFDEQQIIEFSNKNILAGFFLPFCGIGLKLIFCIASKNTKHASGIEFKELIENCHLKKNRREEIERALDILLDTGLFSAAWKCEETEDGILCGRYFFNRNEIASRLKDYKNIFNMRAGEPKMSQNTLKILLLGPKKNPIFFHRVLRINEYLAHIGDIIDRDHMQVIIEYGTPKSYKKFWSFLKNISTGYTYEANIKFYHERKKITLYNLNNWLISKTEEIKKENSGEIENIKLSQVKLRFLIEPLKIENNDFLFKKILMVPIVNFDLKLKNIKFDQNYDQNQVVNNYPLMVDNIYAILSIELIKNFLIYSIKNNDEIASINFVFDYLKFRDFSKINTYSKIYEMFQKTLKEVKLQNKFNPKLNMSFQHLENIKEELIPSLITDRINIFENLLKNKFKKILQETIKELNSEKQGVIITIARKGETILKHIYEIYKNEFSEYEETFRKNFTINTLSGEFRFISETEFLWILRKPHQTHGNILKKIHSILIFDDAIDKGIKLEDIIKNRFIKNGIFIQLENLQIIRVFSYSISSKEVLNELKRKLEKSINDKSQKKIQIKIDHV